MKNLIIAPPLWKIWLALQWPSLTWGFPVMTVAKSRLCALSKCLPGQPALRLQLQFKHVTSRWRSSNENVLVLPNGHVDIHVKKHVRFRNMDLIFILYTQHNRQTLLSLFSSIFICKWQWPINGPCCWVAGWIHGGADHCLAVRGLACAHRLGWLGLRMVQRPSVLLAEVRPFSWESPCWLQRCLTRVRVCVCITGGPPQCRRRVCGCSGPRGGHCPLAAGKCTKSGQCSPEEWNVRL